jgi:protein phosphatase
MKSESINRANELLLARVLEEGAPDNVTFSLIQYKKSAPEIKASDFQGSSYRLPFDQKPYLKHLKSRPMLLMLIFISMILLFLFV